MTKLADKHHGGIGFKVTDPEGYPYGRTTFDEDEPIHARWAGFGERCVVVDVGASFGSFTLPALARGACVLAVEPSVDGWRILNENVAANGWGERFHGERCVLWDGTLDYPEALFKDVFNRSYPVEGVPTVCTLDELARGLPRVDCVKLDVEGAELGVLKGGLEVLEKHLPMLLIEDHDGICPGEPVSDYPASIGSSDQIKVMLGLLGYSVEVLPFGCGRKYIVASHGG